LRPSAFLGYVGLIPHEVDGVNEIEIGYSLARRHWGHGFRELFAQHGAVESVHLISDRDTGRPRGFGFVEMEDVLAAIAALNGAEFGGRTLGSTRPDHVRTVPAVIVARGSRCGEPSRRARPW
jgi:hypothetical protein